MPRPRTGALSAVLSDAPNIQEEEGWPLRGPWGHKGLALWPPVLPLGSVTLPRSLLGGEVANTLTNPGACAWAERRSGGPGRGGWRWG